MTSALYYAMFSKIALLKLCHLCSFVCFHLVCLLFVHLFVKTSSSLFVGSSSENRSVYRGMTQGPFCDTVKKKGKNRKRKINKQACEREREGESERERARGREREGESMNVWVYK